MPNPADAYGGTSSQTGGYTDSGDVDRATPATAYGGSNSPVGNDGVGLLSTTRPTPATAYKDSVSNIDKATPATAYVGRDKSVFDSINDATKTAREYSSYGVQLLGAALSPAFIGVPTAAQVARDIAVSNQFSYGLLNPVIDGLAKLGDAITVGLTGISATAGNPFSIASLPESIEQLATPPHLQEYETPRTFERNVYDVGNDSVACRFFNQCSR